MFRSLTTTYKYCLLEKLASKSKWNELIPTIKTCLGDTLWKILDVHFLNNQDDSKLVIVPLTPVIKTADNEINFDCVEITLGVGGDIESEKKLRNLVPHCRFYGADPIKASGESFKEMGAYFEIAVGSKAGLLQASVLENGTYRNKNVPTITLVDFLKNYAKVDHVDYLFIDNEGAEYGLFEQKAIEKSGIPICQITVEMHGPLNNYQMDHDRFDKLIWSTIEETSFLPIWSMRGNHVRSFYVNVRDRYCLKTFFSSKFCAKM